MSGEQAYKAARTVWSWDRGPCHDYRLGYYRWNFWEFSDGCRGSWGSTPVTAFIRWNRWRKQPARPL